MGKVVVQRDNCTLQRFHKQLERMDAIVLDEMGYVPFSKERAELFFEVVSRAYERTSLIVTTNLPFEQWAEVLGSERLTGALLDRHAPHWRLTNPERIALAEKGKPLGQWLSEVITIVQPETLLKWHRKLIAKKWDFIIAHCRFAGGMEQKRKKNFSHIGISHTPSDKALRKAAR